jgi:hypothetical protein
MVNSKKSVYSMACLWLDGAVHHLHQHRAIIKYQYLVSLVEGKQLANNPDCKYGQAANMVSTKTSHRLKAPDREYGAC